MDKIRGAAALLALGVLLLAGSAAAETISIGDYLSAVQSVVSEMTSASLPVESEATSTVTVSVTDETVQPQHAEAVIGEGSAFTLPITGDLTLRMDVQADAYAWQIRVGGTWVAFSGETASSITLTYAMVADALSGGEVRVRCRYTMNGSTKYSAVAYITVDTETTFVQSTSDMEVSVETYYADAPVSTARRLNARRLSAASLAAAADDDESGEESTTTGSSTAMHTVTIEYHFENAAGAYAAASYIATLPAVGSFTYSVQSPTVQGYLPYQADGDGNFTAPGAYVTLSVNDLDADQTIYVIYKPDTVTYTVQHYRETANDEGYDEEPVYTETLTGSTGSNVPANLAKTGKETGFTALAGYTAQAYSRPAIAADGSTVVKIYYNRSYVLMDFALDDGYGFVPVYARFGATLDWTGVNDPAKAGYTFVGWILSGDTGKTVIQTKDLPTTMPTNSCKYIAQWEPAKSSFTVVYWVENPDNDEYYAFGSETVTAKTGDVVSADTYKEHYKEDIAIWGDTNVQTRDPFIEFKAEKSDKSITVSGDGNSVLNLRYERTEYTLRFYYAMSYVNTSGETIYKVVGGSTYYFGAKGSNTDAISLLDTYTNNSHSDEIGTVEKLPGLNEKGLKREYNSGYVASTTTGYTYYYIEFTAKYGADISELWPVDVFEPVIKTWKGSNTHKRNGETTETWNGEYAVVSAWNGEYKVYYSQNETNQTIKGKYSQLDSNLLWDSSKFGSYADEDNSNLVSYLCFWENGAKVSWSIPRLFRYKIWVTVPDGMDTKGEETNEYNDVTYYLLDTFDTCDNSSGSQQTAPGIAGFENIARAYEDDALVLTEDEEKWYIKGTEVNFYYKRKEYELTLYNEGGEIIRKEMVQYGASISSYLIDPNLDYPETLQKDVYQFSGEWYTTVQHTAGSIYDTSKAENLTMPANDLILYAKWEPVTYTVRLFADATNFNGSNKLVETWSIPYGRTIDDYLVDAGYLIDESGISAITLEENEAVEEKIEEKARTTGNYSEGIYQFVGWFYVDGENGEQPFSLDGSKVTGDLNLYAKWMSMVYAPVAAQFLYTTDSGTVQIAQTQTVEALVGTSVTFDAVLGSNLYAAYQKNYFPTSQSISCEVTAPNETDATLVTAENTVTFNYVYVDKVPYTVYYVTEDENYTDTTYGSVTLTEQGQEVTYKLVAETKTVNTENAIVTENYKFVKGMLPDAWQKTLVLTVDENGEPKTDENVIIFKYTAGGDSAYYSISHYIQNVDGEGYSLYMKEAAPWKIGAEIEAEPLSLTGFEFDEKADGTLTKGSVSEDEELALRLYYTRKQYPYLVRYVTTDADGKEKELASEHAAEPAYYQAIVQVKNEKAFDGYVAKENVAVLNIEAEDEITQNIVTFLYEEAEATFTYEVVGMAGCGTLSMADGDTGTQVTETIRAVSGTANSVTAAASTCYVFEGWYLDEGCTEKVPSEMLSDDGMTITPKKTESSTGDYDYWVSATYYARFVPYTLTITNTGAAADGQSFLFKVTGEGLGDDGLIVTIIGNGSVTLSAVQPGVAYTVTPLNEWSWRYGSDPSQQVTMDETNKTVTCTSSRLKDQWLSGETHRDNVFQAITD